MNIYNPYYWSFYIVYKFIKLTTKKELQDIVPESSTNVFFMGLFNYIFFVYSFSNILSYFPNDYYLFFIVSCIIPICLFFLNRYLFLKDENYKKIEEYFDKKNNLKKNHFILIFIVYILGSIAAMLFATGIIGD
jgi:purine-cytosine permease-like protein